LSSDLPIIFLSNFNEKALDWISGRPNNEIVAGPLANDRFGRYRLLKRIALGGMAEIWLAAEKQATDEGSQVRTLVIKRILPHYAEHPEFVAFFVNEGSIGTRLHHPHIIETF